MAEQRREKQLLYLTVPLLSTFKKTSNIRWNWVVSFANYRGVSQCAKSVVCRAAFGEMRSILEAACSAFHYDRSPLLRLLPSTIVSSHGCLNGSGVNTALYRSLDWNLFNVLYLGPNWMKLDRNHSRIIRHWHWFLFLAWLNVLERVLMLRCVIHFRIGIKTYSNSGGRTFWWFILTINSDFTVCSGTETELGSIVHCPRWYLNLFYRLGSWLKPTKSIWTKVLRSCSLCVPATYFCHLVKISSQG
jgi:hypothetical protein